MGFRGWQPGNGAAAAHTYAAVGVFTATVTGSNPVGESSSATQVEVIPAPRRVFLPVMLNLSVARVRPTRLCRGSLLSEGIESKPMQLTRSTRLRTLPMTPGLRAILGFLTGLAVMAVAVNVYVVNSFDYDIIRRGVAALASGTNPWMPGSLNRDFYNPPFSVLFLWPMLFLGPKAIIALGGALLMAIVFYERAWVATAWFATMTLLWLIAAGNVDMFVMGAGLLCLLIGDKLYSKPAGVVLRVLAYGFLLVKPQGGFFIVAIYILFRRDWLGVLLSLLVYGLPFWKFYPAWLGHMINSPPSPQQVAPQTFMGKFGLPVALFLAIWATLARRWKYWQLGGVLAGILANYGMPGIPIFLTLAAVGNLSAIPVVIVFSALLASLTWITPPPGVDYYTYLGSFMSIYHLSMLGLALVLACYSGMKEPAAEDGDIPPVQDTVAKAYRGLWERIKRRSQG